jgi:4-amino-4-deoxy-L-arabinose transferase-like glycosyltransferase
MNTKGFVILAIVAFLLLAIPGINHGLWRPDEPRVAGTSAEMVRTGDYVVPHLNGKPFLEKPPLYYAVAAVSGAMFDVDQDVPYRLASLLLGALTVLLTFLIASRKHGRITGIIAAGILASTWEVFMLSRWIQVDIALVFGVTLAMFAYLRLIESYKAQYAILLGLATGVAFMAKGLIGPAIIAVSILADIIRQRDVKLLWKTKPYLIIFFAALPVATWIAALYSRGGWPFVREVLVVNNLMRFTGAAEAAALGHQHGPLYYFQGLPGDILPWTLLFIPAIIASVRKFKNDHYISWFIAPFIILTIASTKRGIYLAPLYPAMACMIAVWLSNASRAKWEDVLYKITWGAAFAGSFVPFAGIFLGHPVLGIAMGSISVAALFFILKVDGKQYQPISLVLLICIGLSTCMTVYYQYDRPTMDFLSFTRQAVATAGDREIILLCPEETMDGVFPFVSGKNYRMVEKAADIKQAGLYAWYDRKDAILNEVKKQNAKVDMLIESKKDYHKKKFARLAYITPGIGAGK